MNDSNNIRQNIASLLNEFDRAFDAWPSLDMQDLPRYSAWPGRLLGLEHFPPRTKSREELLREYEREKWQPLLREVDSRSWPSFRAFRDWHETEEPVACLWRDRFVAMPNSAYTALQADVLAAVLERLVPAHNRGTVVELGCGFGAMLLDLAGREQFAPAHFAGGELTDSGVELTRRLAGRFGLPVRSFSCDFLAPDRFDGIPESALIYTSYAMSCLPEITLEQIEGLCSRRPSLVVMFEPVYPQPDEESFFALMRRRYIELNDYNRNMVEVLYRAQEQGMLTVHTVTPPLLGNNPFFPASLLVWEPVLR